MAEAKISQDELICPVCLDLLKDPVTIPCGHSYCKSCITDCWDQDNQTRDYSCPQCRQTFSPRPALAKNTILTEMVEKLKMTKHPAHYAGNGDVCCDLCTGRKFKAVKSCLVCLNSFCQNHLVQHENFFTGYNRHNLMDATGQLQKMICHRHKKLLEVFCHTDKSCICVQCSMAEHKNHKTALAAAERIKGQKHLKERQRKIQEGIQQREKDLQQLRELVKSHKHSAQKAVKDSEKIFAELIHSIKRSCTEVTQLIRAQEMAVVSGAEGLLKRLEQEIAELRRRDAEMEELSHTQDHIFFLQRFHSLSAPPKYKDVHNVPFSSLLSFDGIRESVCQLRGKLENFCKTEIKKISDRVTFTNIVPRTRNNFLQYYRRLAPDSNTVNKYLRMSEENRVIAYTYIEQPYSDHQDRFDEDNFQVLCRESVCGRCYWELEWSGSYGVYISVSYNSITRKGGHKKCLFGHNDQSWSLYCVGSRCSFIHNNKQTELPVECRSSRIGVYVDYSAGNLSFFSVSMKETMSHIHTVQTTFTQPLYPGFYVCYGSLVKLW